VSFFTQVSIEDDVPERSVKKPRAVELRGDSDLANEILDMLDKWHGHKEIWDDELDAQIYAMEREILTTNRKKLAWGKKGTKYFSPSSANSDPRELFHKIRGEKRDTEKNEQPHRGRWRRMGTAFGSVIQRDLLFIEKHWEKEFGYKPPFVPFYVDVNGREYPAWEKFAQEIKHVEHRGRTISMMGQPDGILVDTRTGELIIFEIKSKQTSNAQTGFFSMKEAKEDHAKQVVLYSELYRKYGVTRSVLMYGNLSKKGWNMSPEDYAKNPDLRAFEIVVTEQDITNILDKFVDVLIAIERNETPALDISKFTFNNFKEACINSLTQEEYDDIKGQVVRISGSRLPQWKKNSYLEAWEIIKELYEGRAKV
jgi:hypothetical protein